MIPPFRLCSNCMKDGKEQRIGTSDAPLIAITVGIVTDGLSYDARLPRWAWKLWTRFRPDTLAADGEAGELESIPVKHELCVSCATKMLTDPRAHDILSQTEFLEERRRERRAPTPHTVRER